MRIFVTGATGYVGGALVRRLAADGHEVRALVRATSRVAPLAELGVATFTGDILDRASMREGMSGADWVIHAAADLDLDGPAGRMKAANVEGSENVASLACKLGVGRFLSISSIAFFGGSPADGSPATEETPPRRPFPTLYSETKHAGEMAIREWTKRGLRLSTVYPSLVYGPPGKREGANSILRGLAKGRFPALVAAERRTSWVYLEDLVEALTRVMSRAAPGRDFVLAGDVIGFRELAERVAAIAGVRAPRIDLPVGAARLALALAAPLYRLRGRRPPFSRAQLGSLTRDWVFDDRRAREELGWAPRTLAAGLPPAIDFLLST
ncbi:MAG TPA: NAD-dependent epimerase/dehydratase family protein [Thermoanaerobaculia bacterium]